MPTQTPNVNIELICDTTWKSQACTYICYCSLASSVPYKTGAWSHGAYGSDVDNGTALSGLLHDGDTLLDAPEDTLDVDVHGEVELLFRDVESRFVCVARAGIVDYDVKLSELLLHCLQELLPTFSLGDVGFLKDDLVRVCRRDFSTECRIKVGNENACPL